MTTSSSIEFAVGEVFSLTYEVTSDPAKAAIAAIPLLVWLEAADSDADLGERLAALVAQPRNDAGPPAILEAAKTAYEAAGGAS